MKKKKMLDKQYGVMLNQSFNTEQISFAISNAKDTVESVKAMKAAATELKRAFKEDINIDEIEVCTISQHKKQTHMLAHAIPRRRAFSLLCDSSSSSCLFFVLLNLLVFVSFYLSIIT